MTEVGTLDGFRGLAMASERLLGLTKRPEKSRVGVDFHKHASGGSLKWVKGMATSLVCSA